VSVAREAGAQLCADHTQTVCAAMRDAILKVIPAPTAAPTISRHTPHYILDTTDRKPKHTAHALALHHASVHTRCTETALHYSRTMSRAPPPRPSGTASNSNSSSRDASPSGASQQPEAQAAEAAAAACGVAESAVRSAVKTSLRQALPLPTYGYSADVACEAITAEVMVLLHQCGISAETAAPPQQQQEQQQQQPWDSARAAQDLFVEVVSDLYQDADPSDLTEFFSVLSRRLGDVVAAARRAQRAAEEEGMQGLCVLCERAMPLTFHHLIPRWVAAAHCTGGGRGVCLSHRCTSIDCRRVHSPVNSSTHTHTCTHTYIHALPPPHPPQQGAPQPLQAQGGPHRGAALSRHLGLPPLPLPDPPHRGQQDACRALQLAGRAARAPADRQVCGVGGAAARRGGWWRRQGDSVPALRWLV